MRTFGINYPADNGNRTAASDAIHPGCGVKGQRSESSGRRIETNYINYIFSRPLSVSASPAVGQARKRANLQEHITQGAPRWAGECHVTLFPVSPHHFTTRE